MKAMQRFHTRLHDELLQFGRAVETTKTETKQFVIQERDVSYRFAAHFHPYVDHLMQRLLRESVAGLQAMDTEYVRENGEVERLPDGKNRPVLYADLFPGSYAPSGLVQQPYPVKDLDFTTSGAYSVYNWEIFFHVPLTLAIHLSKNGHFAEAQRWFHFIFDPTDDSDGPTPERFWKVRPFQSTGVRKVEEILVNLATGADPDLREQTIRSIEASERLPFRPHVVARYRQEAYMYKTVMAYLDNLIAWGDSLFRQDTGESIDEALMLYVLATNILGPRPQAVPRKGSVRPQTYAHLRADLDRFGNAQRKAEADLPFDLAPLPGNGAVDGERLATLRSLGKALYFCVPRNDKLLSYWDTVGDRLFKIRNSLNLQGIYRQLALFEPPIDPAMLARATAAGLDVGAVLSGLQQPLPLVRFQLLVQKATELCHEVKMLGNGLLAAMEKEDGETLTLMRARHERAILEMVKHVRYAQLQEASKSKEALLRSLAGAVQKYAYFEQQLGGRSDAIKNSIPALNELNKEERDSLFNMKFSVEEPGLSIREIGVDIAPSEGGSTSDVTFGVIGADDITGGYKINRHEAAELDKLELAQGLHEVSNVLLRIAKGLAVIPTFGIKFHFWGLGGDTSFGGKSMASATEFGSAVSRAVADRLAYEARRSEKMGAYARRQQDWQYQSNLAAGEINQIFKQLRAAQLKEAAAELELENHRKQIENAAEIEHFLNEEGTNKNGKKSNKSLYTWMKREVKGLYGQCFQLAFDVAKKAERALQHELGNPDVGFIQYSYLGGKEGLLAGERLFLDVKRMEMAYHDQNRREYELTKHVSLLQVDPLALLQLRTTGRCRVTLPEALFDMDGPGHYFRRIKSVAVSIPSVVGPYASVNCTLTLLKSSIRKTPLLRDGVYARESIEDDRFDNYFGSTQSIVTSSGQNDPGLFEASLRDERYLPFEGSGVVSEWQLELPANPARNDPTAFDYNTISDVILHLRYTAREGGSLLRKGAMDHLKEAIESAEAAGSVRLFSVRHEFPSEWARFQSQEPRDGSRFVLSLTLREVHYPFWSRHRLKRAKRVDVLARSAKNRLDIFDRVDRDDAGAVKDTLARDNTMGSLLVGRLSTVAEPVGDLKLYFEERGIDDLWIAVTWSGE